MVNINNDTIVKIKPGTSAEKSFEIVIPAEQSDILNKSVEEIVQYGLRMTEDDGLSPKDLRIQDRIKQEMKNQYGFTVNGLSAQRREDISKYLRERDSIATGKKYNYAEIIVASRQTGGKGLDYLVK